MDNLSGTSSAQPMTKQNFERASLKSSTQGLEEDGGHSFRNMIMMEVGEVMKNIEEKREHDMKIVEKIQSDLHSMVDGMINEMKQRLEFQYTHTNEALQEKLHNMNEELDLIEEQEHSLNQFKQSFGQMSAAL